MGRKTCPNAPTVAERNRSRNDAADVTWPQRTRVLEQP